MSLEPAKQLLRQKGYPDNHIELASDVTRVQYIHHKQRMKYVELLADIINQYPNQNPVLPVGPLQPLVMVVGDITGQDEDNIQMPFVGASGHLLTIILNHLGIDRNSLYLTNLIKIYKEKPANEEFEKAIELLHQEIAVVKPKYILSLGEFTLRALMQKPEVKLSEKRGNFIQGKEISIFPTYHPQQLLNIPDENAEGIKKGKKIILEDMKNFFNQIKTNHPDWVYNHVLEEYRTRASQPTT